MSLLRLRQFLDSYNIKYVVISHSVAYTAGTIAALTHIPGRELAKTVIVKVDDTLVMAVVCASQHVDLELLKAATKAKVVQLGGTVTKEITDVPHAGRFFHFKAPGGVDFGFWHTASKEKSSNGDNAGTKRAAEDNKESVKRVCTGSVGGKSCMVSLIVDDQDKAKAFYTEKLNFKIEGDHDLGGDCGRWITAYAPSETENDFKLTFMLAKSDADKGLVGKQGGSFPLYTITTDDIGRDAPILKERGVEFVQEPTDRFYGIESLIKDCFGNVINFIQLKPH